MACLHQFYIGLSVAGGVVHPPVVAMKILRNVMRRGDWDYTVNEGTGSYQGRTEPTLIVSHFSEHDDSLHYVAQELADAFSQHCVGYGRMPLAESRLVLGTQCESAHT